nr:unnamed protein product [Haemonchus contortus]
MHKRSWDEVNVKGTNTTLLILPDSFRATTAAFREDANVERRLYSKLNEVSGFLEKSVARICVLVGLTTDELPAKRDWCKLASSLATAARMSMKVIAVAPPRGEKSYLQNRSDMNDAIELAKSAAVLMKQGLGTLIPVIESSQEPSYGPGAHPRSSSAKVYSRDLIKEYYDALRTYVKTGVDLPPLESVRKVAPPARASTSSKRNSVEESQKKNQKPPSRHSGITTTGCNRWQRQCVHPKCRFFNIPNGCSRQHRLHPEAIVNMEEDVEHVVVIADPIRPLTAP